MLPGCAAKMVSTRAKSKSLPQRPEGLRFCVRIGWMNSVFSLTLASNSPRRRQMLAWTGWDFQTAPADIDESPRPGETPAEYVQRLAREKALASAQTQPDAVLILASDTTVADGSQLLGKPADAEEARRMLRQLRGRTHQVYTALAVRPPHSSELLEDLCCTDVPMRAYTDAEIEAYIATGDPFDKAGAYAIQHPGFRPVETLQGCYASVMGLPLCHLVRTLRRLHLEPLTAIPPVCMSNLGYDCPVWQSVLAGKM